MNIIHGRRRRGDRQGTEGTRGRVRAGSQEGRLGQVRDLRGWTAMCSCCPLRGPEKQQGTRKGRSVDQLTGIADARRRCGGSVRGSLPACPICDLPFCGRAGTDRCRVPRTGEASALRGPGGRCGDDLLMVLWVGRKLTSKRRQRRGGRSGQRDPDAGLHLHRWPADRRGHRLRMRLPRRIGGPAAIQ